MESTQKERILIIALAAVIIVAVILAFFVVVERRGNVPSTVNNASQTTSTPTVPTASITPTSLPVPSNAMAPNQGATNTPSGTAVPTYEVPASPSSNYKYRSFNITVQNNQFSPNTIIVNVDDVVNLYFTAVGGDYDFTQPDLGFHLSVPNGKTTQLNFDATLVGNFLFYCSTCGGPTSGPTGHLIVTATQ